MIVAAGIDYKNSPLEVRETFSLNSGGLDSMAETITLSTCNRSEIYANCDEFDIDYLRGLFPENVAIKKNTEAIRHCFRVAAGLESMVVGEDQILGQVKAAYEAAVENKSGGKILNRLFLDSITAAKKIKNLTGVSSGNLSVASIGLKLLEEAQGGLSGKKALIIGLGKMNRITHQILTKKNLKQIYAINRSSTEIAFKDRYNYIDRVDFIVSCTSAPHLIMHREKFSRNYSGNKPLYILDLAVPRDIEPDVETIPGIKLFKIDDIQGIARVNYEKRLSYINDAELIIKEGMEKYLSWLEKNTTRLCLI